MESFDELGLSPELVEALAAEGIETPSSLQADAIPVLKQGNPAVLRAGPGGGTLVTWGAPLLNRLPTGGTQPVGLILTPTPETAQETALSLARLGLATGHRCAALHGGWALPGHADLLVGTPTQLAAAVRNAEVKLDAVEALVLDGATLVLDGENRDRVGIILESIGKGEIQGVVVSDPVTVSIREWVDAHLRRAVFLPGEAAGTDRAEAPLQRGTILLHPGEATDPLQELIPVVSQVLSTEIHHILLFCRSEDRAADAADLLTLHGYQAGAPGDPDAPIWLGLDPLADRKAVDTSDVAADRIATLSLDLPLDVDALDRRHGGGSMAVCVASPRELPHLRRLAREAGYRLDKLSQDPDGALDEVEAFRNQIRTALESRDLAAYTTLIQPLLKEWTGVEIAAAMAAILRDRGEEGAPGATRTTRVQGAGPRPPAWTRLFISIGSKDGVGPGDLLGAITGEAGLKGDQVGRIDVKDTFSRVEVQDAQAGEVIKALNGTSIRGRSIRVDFDRGGTREGKEGESRPREGGGRPRDGGRRPRGGGSGGSRPRS